MQPGTLKALEFDRIVEAVRACAETPMGRERLARLAPSADPQKVAQLLAATTEVAHYVGRYGLLPLRAPTELGQMLDWLAIQGRLLEGHRLLMFAGFLDSVEETRAAIRKVASECPLLDQVSASSASFKHEIGQIRDKIDPSGEVVDHASTDLKLIRERLRKQKTRLRSTLESYLRGKETAKYLQEQVVTERSGRYVLVDCGVGFVNKSVLGAERVLPDLGFLAAHRDQIEAVLITHGHEDHIGALPWVVPELDPATPIFASSFTTELVRHRMNEHGLWDPARMRLFAPRTRFECGPFAVDAVRVTHSIPDCQSVALRSEAGTVLHTADWKIDDEPMDVPIPRLDRGAFGPGHLAKGVLDTLPRQVWVEPDQRGAKPTFQHDAAEVGALGLELARRNRRPAFQPVAELLQPVEGGLFDNRFSEPAHCQLLTCPGDAILGKDCALRPPGPHA